MAKDQFKPKAKDQTESQRLSRAKARLKTNNNTRPKTNQQKHSQARDRRHEKCSCEGDLQPAALCKGHQMMLMMMMIMMVMMRMMRMMMIAALPLSQDDTAVAPSAVPEEIPVPSGQRNAAHNPRRMPTMGA